VLLFTVSDKHYSPLFILQGSFNLHLDDYLEFRIDDKEKPEDCGCCCVEVVVVVGVLKDGFEVEDGKKEEDKRVKNER
jgi:hypothetical protein